MLILIIGPRQSGKSSLMRALAKRLGVKGMDTSDVLIEKLADIRSALAPSYFDTKYPTMKDWILANKESHRAALIALGDMLCGANPRYLWDACRERDAVIICGVRRKLEFYEITHESPFPFVVKLRGDYPADNYELDDVKPSWLCESMSLAGFAGDEAWAEQAANAVLRAMVTLT